MLKEAKLKKQNEIREQRIQELREVEFIQNGLQKEKEM